MKKVIIVCLSGCWIFLAQTVVFAEGLTKITDRVYSYVYTTPAAPGNSFSANAGIIIGKDDVLVVDTLISAKEADRFIADIKTITNKPIRYVVDTHYHPDHAFGNSEFAKLGAIIIAQAQDKDSLAIQGSFALKDMSSMGLSAEDMAGTTLAVPTLSFTDRMTIDLGEEKVELIYPGPTHSAGSLLVFIPDEKVLFTGDILFTNFHPYMADGNIPGWIKALDLVQTMDVSMIIPGHGPLSSKKDVADMKAYLKLFDQKARQLARRMKDPDKIAEELKKVLPRRDQLDWAIAENVKGLYLPKKN